MNRQPAAPLVSAPCPPGWHAGLLPVSTFPVPGVEKQPLAALLEEFATVAVTQHRLTREVFLQHWKLSLADTAELYLANVRTWLPQTGLGVWPGRRPPARWTQEGFADAAAAMLEQREPELNVYKLLRLTGSDEARTQAVRMLCGNAALVQIFPSAGYDRMCAAGKDRYLPGIEDPAFRRFPFYLPLLSLASCAAAIDLPDTHDLIPGADLYLRESPEDGGILIVSRYPIEPSLDHARQRVTAQLQETPR